MVPASFLHQARGQRSPLDDLRRPGFRFIPAGDHTRILARDFSVVVGDHPEYEQSTKGDFVSILWIVLIVVLVLALLGFFGRGRW